MLNLFAVEFKEELRQCKLNSSQRSMFKMRTDLLDSYLSETARNITSWFGHGKLVVVDLSDPFLDGVMAHSVQQVFLLNSIHQEHMQPCCSISY
jgi:hypothetical protein